MVTQRAIAESGAASRGARSTSGVMQLRGKINTSVACGQIWLDYCEVQLRFRRVTLTFPQAPSPMTTILSCRSWLSSSESDMTPPCAQPVSGREIVRPPSKQKAPRFEDLNPKSRQLIITDGLAQRQISNHAPFWLYQLGHQPRPGLQKHLKWWKANYFDSKRTTFKH